MPLRYDSKNCSRVVWFLLLLPLFANAAKAQELSLVQALHLSFIRNWDLLASKSELSMAKAQNMASHEFPNPAFSYSTAKVNIDGRSSSTNSGNSVFNRNYDSIAAVSQLIEIGGKRSIRQASTHFNMEVAKGRFLDMRRQLELGVAKAYITALLAEENVRILDKTAKLLGKQADIAQLRLKVGDISRSDKDQIEISLERLELDAQSAKTNKKSALISLELLLGNPNPQGELHLTDSLDNLADEHPPSVDLDEVTNRPDVVAAQANVNKTKADLLLQRALRIPDPTISLQFEVELFIPIALSTPEVACQTSKKRRQRIILRVS
jgi:cobalt-zinc-cadmium efflux system outer membrane protein